jgi:hypothetical protein
VSMGIVTSFFNGLSFGCRIYNPTTGGMVGDRSRQIDAERICSSLAVGCLVLQVSV